MYKIRKKNRRGETLIPLTDRELSRIGLKSGEYYNKVIENDKLIIFRAVG